MDTPNPVENGISQLVLGLVAFPAAFGQRLNVAFVFLDRSKKLPYYWQEPLAKRQKKQFL